MKGWNVGQPMTYSEIDRLIEMVKNEIKIRKLDRDDTKMENEKKYKKCDLKLDKFCGLPCNDIADGYCMLQIIEPEYDEVTAKKISEAHELAKRKAGKLDRTKMK